MTCCYVCVSVGRLALAGRCSSSVINRMPIVKQVSATAQLNNAARPVSDLQHVQLAVTFACLGSINTADLFVKIS